MPLLIPLLKQKGRLDQTPMTIANVGSRKITPEDDYTSKGWGLFAPHLVIYGFDADADACDAANADLEARQITWVEKHIPLALADRVGEATLYVTKDPMCSSLYPPNESYLARFAGMLEVSSADFSFELEVTTLDQVCQTEGIAAIDFLQIDVQGADLQVLEGAGWLLERSILAVQVEVEFSSLYRGQPLFADVDQFMRNQGFTFFDLDPGYRVRARSPIQSTDRGGQLLWGDAFYFRDLIQAGVESPLNTPEQIFKLACIADVLEFPDYALELLEYLTLHYGDDPLYNFADAIVETLSAFPLLVEQGLETLPVIQSIREYVSEGKFARLK
jgi:FkbM family methyltransferase